MTTAICRSERSGKMKREYKEEIEKLTARAKKRKPDSDGLNIGEKFFTDLLYHYIGQYRIGQMTVDELKEKKKQLEKDLVNYWDLKEIFKLHCEIRNRQSSLLIKAEKEGCPICRQLVRIFDGRAVNADYLNKGDQENE